MEQMASQPSQSQTLIPIPVSVWYNLHPFLLWFLISVWFPVWFDLFFLNWIEFQIWFDLTSLCSISCCALLPPFFPGVWEHLSGIVQDFNMKLLKTVTWWLLGSCLEDPGTPLAFKRGRLGPTKLPLPFWSSMKVRETFCNLTAQYARIYVYK